jgi:predicted ArsR family transcriptional regulator
VRQSQSKRILDVLALGVPLTVPALAKMLWASTHSITARINELHAKHLIRIVGSEPVKTRRGRHIGGRPCWLWLLQP